jgi:hypothetical protein
VGGAPRPQHADDQSLSRDELWQLTLYKWRYTLEAMGFEESEVRHLLFQKWRVLRLDTLR